MDGDKIFGSAMFGFDKNDVNAYIDKILKEFEQKLGEKEEEINLLRLQNKDLKVKNEELSKNSEKFSGNKEKIVEVLMVAQEKADNIVKEAKLKADRDLQALEEMVKERKIELEKEVEKEKIKIEEMKNEMQKLKQDAFKIIQKFEMDVSTFVS